MAGLGRASALAQVSEQAASSGLHEIQHFLEAVRPPVVRVRNLLRPGLGSKLEE